MNNINKNEVLTELKETKEQLIESIDTQLGNIKSVKDELEQFKTKLEGYPDYVVDRELRMFNVKHKLLFVTNEIAIHKQIDEAIDFLESLLNKQAS